MVSTCKAQPIAQLSPASYATASAVAATWPASSTSPRKLCVRAASTSSRAPCRAEIPGGSQGLIQPGQGLGEPAHPHPALGQRPVQVNEEIGLDGQRQGPGGRPLGLGRIADPVHSVREPGHQTVVPARASRGTRDRVPQEFRGHLRRLADQRLGGASQPAQHPLVHRLGWSAWSADRLQQLPGHPVRWRAGLGQGAPGIAVPRGAHRRRYLVVERRTDQRVPEPKTFTEFGQHAGGAGLIDGREQADHAATQHDRQVRHGDIHTQQGRRPQHLARRPGNKAQPVRYRRRQGAWRGAAGQLGGARRSR
jgi:hypothetical protein